MGEELCRRHFGLVEDSRFIGFVEYPLRQVLTLVMCSCMCGWDSLKRIVKYGECKAEFLRDRFGIKNIPSISTLLRVPAMVNGELVAECVMRIMREFISDDGDIAAFDGKAIRQTFQDKRCEQVHIMSAFVTETGLLPGNQRVSEKTDEIPVMREMLQFLNLSGKIVTADAMHCQLETVERITEKGGDYFIGLKDNQKNFHDEVKEYFESVGEGVLERASMTEENKSRFEMRNCRKSAENCCVIDAHKEWKNLTYLYEIERITISDQKTGYDLSYYISSLDVSPERAIEISREHWNVESMHHVLDVSFSEDDCRVLSKDGQISLNAFRKLTFAMHKDYTDRNTKKKTKETIHGSMDEALLNDAYLLRVLRSV